MSCQWKRMSIEEDGNGTDRGCMDTRHHSDNGHSEDELCGDCHSRSSSECSGVESEQDSG